MVLDHASAYRVFCARDARFDGRVFVGVHTTGIYCRPICPAPPPKQSNVSFFETAVLAQQAGFRPCLRCRPEVSPRFAAWGGSSGTVTRALKLIEAGALDQDGVEDFAERLGMGGRQLRRLFVAHVGATPTAFAQMRRVHLAKQLLQETDLAVTEIAHAAGYGSLRRFNEAFRAMFGRTPSAIRKGRSAGTRLGGIALRLGVAPPYDWEGVLRALSRRAVPGVEMIDGGRYVRTVQHDGGVGTLAVTQLDERTLELLVRFPKVEAFGCIVAKSRVLLDVSADPDLLLRSFQDDAVLGARLARRPGVRVPGPWDAFEHMSRCIIEHYGKPQEGRMALAHFVEAFGTSFDAGAPGLTHGFPDPAVVAGADLRSIFDRAEVREAISAYAQATKEGKDPLSVWIGTSDAIGLLTALPGFDQELAERCAIGFLHPTDELPVGTVDPPRFSHWRPWRAYAVALDDASFDTEGRLA